MKTHTLIVETGEGVTERVVDAQERLLVRVGAALNSWKVGELRRVQVEHAYGDEQIVLYVDTFKRGGSYTPIVRGGVVELGEDRWPVTDLVSLVLEPIPATDEPEAEPQSNSRTWLLRRTDGSEEIVEVLGAAELRGSLDPSVPLAEGGWGVDLEHVLSLERIEEGVTV